MDGDESPQLRRRRFYRNKDEEQFFVHRQRFFQVDPSTIFLLIFFLAWAFWLSTQIEHRLPSPILGSEEANNPGRFIAEYAYALVQNLTKIGPRPAGSFENEVGAVNLLSNQLNLIAKRASRAHRITIELQKASGAFSLEFLDGMTNVYKDVQNIILKIGPHVDIPHSILMNCHFDSVADSPGGSDNSAGCAVMLEILRVISISHVPLKNNIIFLFNGAEENLLQGSHGFITQHKWAKNIRAFVNLEACGTGGRELLFQAGPENPWLMEVYASSVPYPLASTLAQEIFQTGLIPGDTDYRIFRDYGGIPGLDFAWAMNGYVYHTKLDNAEHVPIKSLQRTGDNLLPLTIKLANLNYDNSYPRGGNLVFFDILGIFIFRVPELSAFLINIGVILYSNLILLKNYRQMSSAVGCSKYYYGMQLSLTCIVTLFSWLITLLFVHLYSQVITFLERSMSWYARPVWLFYLYALPALCLPARITNVLADWQKEKLLSPMFLMSLRIDSNQILWTLTLLLTTTIFYNRSAIFITFMLGFVSLANSALHHVRNSPSTKEGKCLQVYMIIMLLPFLQFSYMINGCLLVVVPILGRAGSGHNTEGMIALLTCAMFLLLLNFIIPFFSIVRDYRKVLRTLYGIFIAAFIVLIVTPLGFPYSSDIQSPAPQRYMIMHVEQITHGYDGKVISDSGGLWIVDLDMNSPKAVSRIVPEVELARKVDTCDRLLYCGLPFLIPVRSIISESHWIKTQKPRIIIPVTLTLNQIETLEEGVKRYFFTANGPDHMSLIISPVMGAMLVSWSFLEETPLAGPEWNGRSTYFVYLSYSSSPQPWNFTLDFKTQEETGPAMDLAITGHFLHGAHQRSVRLNKLLSQFPPWTVTSGWVATYISYVF